MVKRVGTVCFEDLTTGQRTELLEQLKVRLESVDTCLLCGRDTAYTGEEGMSAYVEGSYVERGTGISRETLMKVENAVVFCSKCASGEVEE